MTDSTTTRAGSDAAGSDSVTSFSDFGRDMWSFLTGKDAVVDYTFVDMSVEVPRATGPNSPRATWKLNGTLRITTSDRDNRGAANGRAS